jgi:iron complex transport system substrate-binding protein
MRNDEVFALSRAVLGVAMQLHSEIGPGLFERVYAVTLLDDLVDRGFTVRTEVAIGLTRRGRNLPLAYRLDLLVDERLIVEVKACNRLTDVHERQVQTYLRLANVPMGLLLNFNVSHLRDGFRRVLPARA